MTTQSKTEKLPNPRARRRVESPDRTAANALQSRNDRLGPEMLKPLQHFRVATTLSDMCMCANRGNDIGDHLLETH